MVRQGYTTHSPIENGEALEQDKETFDTEIHVSESLDNRFNGKQMELRIEFSILQAEYAAIADVWKDSPYQWRESIRVKYFNN